MSGSFRERIRALVDIYQDVQSVRISSFNRLRTVGEVKGVDAELLRKLEGQIRDHVEGALQGVPVWEEFLKHIKGIGPILAGGLVSWLDPEKADHASGFWKFCGLHVVDGKAVKRKKGKKLGFNVKMRTLAWKIGTSFIRQRTPGYSDIYYEAKVRENEKLGNPIENPKNCPRYKECVAMLRSKASRIGRAAKKPPCKKHIDNRARRKMVKRFLSDLWAKWRALEDLPVTEPYAHAKDQHTTIGVTAK